MKVFILLIACCSAFFSNAQLFKPANDYTREDSLRGFLNENRNWWDVQSYDLSIEPNIAEKTLVGKMKMAFKALKSNQKTMQIDLQTPMVLDSIFYKNKTVKFTKNSDNTWLLELPFNPQKNTIYTLIINYHGKPKIAKNPPWDGGWIWKKDAQKYPWITAAVQGLGASSWFPCKDHLSDEPEKTIFNIIVPDSLKAVANGRLQATMPLNNGKTQYQWKVINPINSYCIIPYIGNYTAIKDSFYGLKGKLDLTFWVLDYNKTKAAEHFKQVKPMLQAMEYWAGAYPFYEDGFQLVETPHLGMEHQSAIAYGNGYQNGYLGKDRSGTGWGMDWDFIIVHEAGHEWFGNNISVKDNADLWIHEAFTSYLEALYVEYFKGKKAASEYVFGSRKLTMNDQPIIGDYNVNKEGSGDMYVKGAAMLHTIRQAIQNDSLFRAIILGLNKKFYHKTVSTKDIENYFIEQTGLALQPIFNQYLRTNQIPKLQYYFKDNYLYYRYANGVDGFNLPVYLQSTKQKIVPTKNWNKLFIPENVEQLTKAKIKEDLAEFAFLNFVELDKTTP